MTAMKVNGSADKEQQREVEVGKLGEGGRMIVDF